jgi:hypothetical protein
VGNPAGRVPDMNAREAGERYRPELAQLDYLIDKHERARAVADWALGFFDGAPDIELVAKTVSRKVDDALLEVGPWNKPKEFVQTAPFFDVTNWLDWWREPLDYATRLYANNLSQTALTYKIPRATAVGIWAVEDLRGRCEEHTFLALYLLTLGHMIQNQLFGRLRNDIYYSGMAVKGHAFVVLVKGAEAAEGLRAAPKDVNQRRTWLFGHMDQWGKSAWIIDGYEAARSLALERRTADAQASESFRRNTDTAERSEWDLTVITMMERIAADYKIAP